MNLKLIPILIIMFIGANASSQTYYNPRQKLDISITIKEPYKPVDYSAIASDVSKRLSSEVARREELKRYYDQIIFETKNSIQASLLLTNDYHIDGLIFKLNDVTFQYLDKLNKSLKAGILKPSDYEFKIRNIYHEHINSNKLLVNLIKFKYQKELSIKNNEELKSFRKKYELSVNRIQEFTIDNQDKYLFSTSSYYNGSKYIINILNFITFNL